MSATERLMSIGFVPPYIFDQLSKVDPERAEAWKKSRTQAALVFERRAKESQLSPSVPLASGADLLAGGELPQVKVISLQARPVRSDQDARNAKSHGETVIKFLFEELKRSSYDGKGSELKIYVHDKEALNNAHWLDDAVYIGDSTFLQHTSLTADVDITAHEVGHGVDQYTVGFFYEGQSGALAESWADVFGSMVKQYSQDQTAEVADWLIGDKYVVDLPIRVQALRSMKSPGNAYLFSDTERDPQIDHMSKMESVDLSQFDEQDYGGVHIFSGIPNKAFYQFAMGFPQFYSWTIAGKIWYKALQSSLDKTATFQQFAEATVKAAKEINDFPDGISVENVVTRLEDSWKRVGIKLKKPPEKTTKPEEEVRIPMSNPPALAFFSSAPHPSGRAPLLDDRAETSHRHRKRRRERKGDSCSCVLL